MNRVTTPELTNFFMRLCKDLGKKICLSEGQLKALRKWRDDGESLPCEVVPYGTVGAWRLDYAGCYGGWQIQELCESGGISCPFFYRRYKAKDLIEMIHFAREVLRLKVRLINKE